MFYVFGEYTLDTQRYELRRAGMRLPLRRKVFQVLTYLIEQRHRVVTRDELLEHVWPDQCVGEETLTSCVKAARRVVGDSGQAQCVIQTVHGCGLRFVADVMAPDVRLAPLTALAHSAVVGTPRPLLVGRAAELTLLHQWYATARQGQRQVVFITGEAGSGKTALVEAFAAQVTGADVWIGHGQCIEQYGTGEAYLPVLEALGRLCRGPEGPYFLAWLRQHAPSWLSQMPTLLQETDHDICQRLTQDVTQVRMLRELAEALECLTVERPLILLLVDLHWSDSATLEWLAYVARRRDLARLLVLCTYRLEKARVVSHPLYPLTRELLVHGQGAELVLGTLSVEEVATYVTQRLGEGALVAELVPVLYERTQGNPLFLTTMVADLIHRGVLREGPTGWACTTALDTATVGVPETLRHLIEQQFECLEPAEQTVLEAASVAGVDFAAAAVAAGVGASVEDVDTRCARLARQGQFILAHGPVSWPQGPRAGRYHFGHALYQEVVYDRIPVGCRTRLHHRIGMWAEQAYGERAGERATELAMHFERGQDARRAVRYLLEAGVHAIQWCAHQQALSLLSKALEVLTTWPEGPERNQQELVIQLAMSTPLCTTRGWAAVELEQKYARAWALCQQLRQTARLCPILLGLGICAMGQGQLQKARELLEHALTLARQNQDGDSLMRAYTVLGITRLFLGEFAAAHAYFEQGVALAEGQTPHSAPGPAPWHPHLTCLGYDALTLWLLGYPEQAMQRSHAAMRLAQQWEHPYMRVSALRFAAILHQFRRETQQTQTYATAMLALAREQRFVAREAEAIRLQGWVLARQGQAEEGIHMIRQGLAAVRATGEALQILWPAILAEAYRGAGQASEGLRILADALGRFSPPEERLGDAELYRHTGELLLHIGPSRSASHGPSPYDARVLPESPEACFLQALALARRQHARSLELRAAVSLGRLWQRQGKGAAARELLAQVYGWFTEGFDTTDLQEAQTLLAELAGQPPAASGDALPFPDPYNGAPSYAGQYAP